MCTVAGSGGSPGGSYSNVAPGFDSNLGGTYDQYSPGNVVFDTASEGVSNTYSEPMAQMEPSFTSRPVQRPAAPPPPPVLYAPTSGNVGYGDRDSVWQEPPSSMQAGYVQPDIRGKMLTGLTKLVWALGSLTMSSLAHFC